MALFALSLVFLGALWFVCRMSVVSAGTAQRANDQLIELLKQSSAAQSGLAALSVAFAEVQKRASELEGKFDQLADIAASYTSSDTANDVILEPENEAVTIDQVAENTSASKVSHVFEDIASGDNDLRDRPPEQKYHKKSTSGIMSSTAKAAADVLAATRPRGEPFETRQRELGRLPEQGETNASA